MPPWYPLGPDFVFQPLDIHFLRLSRYNEYGAQGTVTDIAVSPFDAQLLVAVDAPSSGGSALHVSEDGGKNFKRAPNEDRHVDDHALWINPKNTDHMLIGCDGGIYETYDRGAKWDFKANLPVTQFYKVAVDVQGLLPAGSA